MAGSLKYIKGDATNPVDDGEIVIIHVVNDKNLWGSGFVLALSAKWLEPELWYRRWFGGAYKINGKRDKPALGKVQLVPITGTDIVVANLIGQHDVRTDPNGEPPIRYDAIETGLKEIAAYCDQANASVHCPKFGADRAGGDWNQIEALIKSELIAHGIDVTVYEFDDPNSPSVSTGSDNDTDDLMPF